MRYLVLPLAVVLAAPAALAEDAAKLPANSTQILAAIAALPEDVRSKLLDNPRRYAAAHVRVILEYGGPGGIDAGGIDLFIAKTRAEARTDIFAPLIDADLDADRTVTRDELERLCSTLSSLRQGYVRETFDFADGDQDGAVTLSEAVIAAELKASGAVTELDELTLRSLPRFDLDGNGRVSQAEMEDFAAVARSSLAKATRKKGKAKESDA